MPCLFHANFAHAFNWSWALGWRACPLASDDNLVRFMSQAKATHALQLRTILQKLISRGLLAPESASYISALPPTTPIAQAPPYGASLHSATAQAHVHAQHQAALASLVAQARASSGAPSTSGNTRSVDLAPMGSSSGPMEPVASSESSAADLPRDLTVLGTSQGFPNLPANLSGGLSSESSTLSNGLHLGASSGPPFPISQSGRCVGRQSQDGLPRDSLQAHLDALEGALGPLSSQSSYPLPEASPNQEEAYPTHLMRDTRDVHPGTVSLGGVSLDGGASIRSSVDLQGDEAIQLFTESAQYDQRQQPYPVGASPPLAPPSSAEPVSDTASSIPA